MLKILSITRVHPAPCRHFEIVAEVDGQTYSRILYEKDILKQLDDFEGGYRGALVLSSLRRHLVLGGNRNEIIGVELDAHLGPPTVGMIRRATNYVRNFLGLN